MGFKDKNTSKQNRREFLLTTTAAICGLSLSETAFGKIAENGLFQELKKDQPMREIPAASRVVIAKDEVWYHGFTGVAESKGILVCSYLKTDQHLRTTTDIMIARSTDGGLTWKDHRSLTHHDIENHSAIWVAPELNILKDGRLVLLCDKGQRKVGQELPVLSTWQTSEYGMSNWIFFSDDGGLTWTEPQKTDDVGGEPERVHELSNGAWVYTRTDARPTKEIKNPVAPWGANYYRSTAVFSDDKGKTWNRTVAIVDDPLIGDCEVGISEYAPGKIAAFTRIGDAGSRYGQPSRGVYSSDFGKSWSKPILMPFYGHRPIPGMLKSGKMLVTFRNSWGTTGTYAFLFSPNEKFTFQPNSFIWDESRCQLNGDAMEIKTDSGSRNAVQFSLYPVEDDDSVVEMNAEFSVKEADREGCLISAGCWVRFFPNRIELADRPAESINFDTTNFHKYRFINKNKQFSIYIDGQLKLQTSTDGIHTRYVRFGNRPGGQPPSGTISAEVPQNSKGKSTTPLRGVQFFENTSHTLWRSISAKVMNRRDHSIDWSWSAKKGFPDQFRRDRFVRLERNGTFAAGDSGYSGWTQMTNGKICIVDYTTGDEGKMPPAVKAYLVSESDLA